MGCGTMIGPARKIMSILNVIKCYSLFSVIFSKVQNDEKMLSYKDFCKNMEQQNTEFYLMTDLRVRKFCLFLILGSDNYLFKILS